MFVYGNHFLLLTWFRGKRQQELWESGFCREISWTQQNSESSLQRTFLERCDLGRSVSCKANQIEEAMVRKTGESYRSFLFEA